MKISKLSIGWFRGAAQRTELTTNNKSVVVYGPNGSGKSSFIDAIEYLIDGHRVGHLRHEYSGRNQEKALINVNKPAEENASIELQFENSSEKKVQIDAFGNVNHESTCSDDPCDWDYRRTVLRQDEVAAFVNDSKADKYSTLLPLLGLGELEATAANTRVLKARFTSESKIKEKRALLDHVVTKAKEFGTTKQVVSRCTELFPTYGLEISSSEIDAKAVQALSTSIKGRVASLGAESKKQLLLTQIGLIDLKSDIAKIRSTNSILAESTETFISERISVLTGATDFIVTHTTDTVQCPACGQEVQTQAFRDHVQKESTRLQSIMDAFKERATAIRELNSGLKRLYESISSYDGFAANDTANKLNNEEQSERLRLLSAATQSTYSEEDLLEIESHFVGVIDWASKACNTVRPDSTQLAADLNLVNLTNEVLRCDETKISYNKALDILSALSDLEGTIRTAIRQRATEVINSISGDIQRMWALLHPHTQIEGIKLFVPDVTDKAIDIHLKFYGVDQDSPRLTLSEGYRNSLGLCIFLAMVKFEGNHNRPLFLDDVVVSLDREHRGMIRKLLASEFEGFQIVLLTHDREWFAELRMLLDGQKWSFRMLMPFAGPQYGIRFSEAGNFEGARSLLDTRPDSSGNDARKIMDVELPMIAEKLELMFPFVRGHKNDQRLSHEILEKLISAGSKCFQTNDGTKSIPNAEALERFKEADRLLIAWGNRASHTFDVVKAEAATLIDACDAAMKAFSCANCKKKLWAFENAKSRQCGCGTISWRTD